MCICNFFIFLDNLLDLRVGCTSWYQPYYTQSCMVPVLCRTRRMRCWWRMCGWTRSGTTCSSRGSPRTMMASRCYACPATSSGCQILCSITSEQTSRGLTKASSGIQRFYVKYGISENSPSQKRQRSHCWLFNAIYFSMWKEYINSF